MKLKAFALYFALMLSSIVATAQTQVIRFQENIDKLDVSTFVAKDGLTYTNLSFNGAISLGELGSPTLPKIRHFVVLPLDVIPTIKVKEYTTQDFTLKELGASAQLAPYQPSRTKSQREEDVSFVVNRKAYAADAFVQNDIATVTVLGTWRGVQIAQVDINPVSYNPARGVVRQFKDIEVEVQYDAPTSEVIMPAHLNSPYFDVIWQLMSNTSKATRSAGDDYPEHPDLTKYPVRMLIVANRMFEETLQPFILWKTQKGFDVEVAYTDEIGGWASDIRAYIKGRYENSASEGKAPPTFLVIVGDVDQVPASKTYEWTTGEFYESDYMYAQMDRDAYERFPEMYYGRLSAETTDELKAIIDKIIYYEKYQFSDPSYLSRSTIIAGVDPGGLHASHAEPKMKYLVANYLNSEGGYDTVYEYGVNDENNALSRDDYSGCYDSERIGVGFFTYTAHADQYRWDNPRLDKVTLDVTSNENKYPFVLANCCLSSDFAFDRAPCIGEEWLRKPQGGAVTYIGVSPTSAWKEDREWTLGNIIDGEKEWTFDNTTMGAYDAPFISDYVCAYGMVFVGNLAVTKSSIIGMIEKYWTGYNVLGDPSLIPYWGEAKPINATFGKTISLGSTTFTVKAPQRSLVALSSKDKLLCSALVGVAGTVDLSFDAVETSDDLTLVITKPQHQPVITTITVGAESAIDEIATSSSPATIDIFNLQGIPIRSITAGEVEHITDNLPPGTYVVVTTTQRDRTVKKIVVK